MKASPEINQFAGEAHACAMQMLSNAAYIQKELPGLEMPDLLRNQIEKLCTDLIDTKHDLIHEIQELDEFLASAPYQIEPWVERIRGWIAEQVNSIDECVTAVNEAASTGAVPFSVAMLIMESATNILSSTPASPSIADPADEIQTEDGEENDDCYGFYSEDSYPVGQLVDAIRDLIDRPELEPETIGELRVFLFAMEHRLAQVSFVSRTSGVFHLEIRFFRQILTISRS